MYMWTAYILDAFLVIVLLFNIIKTTIHDTKGNEIPTVVPVNIFKQYIAIGQNVVPGKRGVFVPAYYRIYGSSPLTILKIYLKNSDEFEAIILNL